MTKSQTVPSAVARLDACVPGMQTVTGSIITSGNIVSWRLDLKNEPAREIVVLFVLRKLILQTCMCSHPVVLDVQFLGSQGELIVYQWSVVRPSLSSSVRRRPHFQT